MGKQQFPCPGWGLPMLGLTPGQELLQSWGGTWDWHCRAHTCARISPACPDVQGDGDSCAPSPWEAQSSARVPGRMGTAQCRGETKGFRDTWQPPAPPMLACASTAAVPGLLPRAGGLWTLPGQCQGGFWWQEIISSTCWLLASAGKSFQFVLGSTSPPKGSGKPSGKSTVVCGTDAGRWQDAPESPGGSSPLPTHPQGACPSPARGGNPTPVQPQVALG